MEKLTTKYKFHSRIFGSPEIISLVSKVEQTYHVTKAVCVDATQRHSSVALIHVYKIQKVTD
jgi:hypothetical protein